MKPDTPERELAIRNLKNLVAAYDDLNKAITGIKNRLHALNPDADAKNDPILNGEGKSQGLEQVKMRLSRLIEKELRAWPLYTQYLKGVPGIGPAIAARLIILYYYRFTPVCQCGTALERRDGTFWCPTCEKSTKGDGVTRHKIEVRDFANISKWWKFMGMHVNGEGKKPKREKGVKQNWSSVGRATCYLIGDQFNRQSTKTPYGRFLLETKARIEERSPEIKPGHRLNRARNQAAKLFLAHLWAVAREIDGLPVTEPYAGTILGHTGIFAPFHWKDGEEVAA